MNEKTILCKSSKAPGVVLLILGIICAGLCVLLAITNDGNLEMIYTAIFTGVLAFISFGFGIKTLIMKNLYIYFMNQTIYFKNVACKFEPKVYNEGLTNKEVFSKYISNDGSTIAISKQDIIDLETTNTNINGHVGAAAAASLLGGAIGGAIYAAGAAKKMSNDKIVFEVNEGFIIIYIAGNIANQIKTTLDFDENLTTIEPMKNLDELE